VVSELFDIRQLGQWKDKLRPGFLPLPINLDEAMQLPLLKRSGAAKKVLLRAIGRAIADRLGGRQRATAGQALQGQMLHAALKAGVEFRLECPVRKLLLEDGRVTGVQADTGEVRARLGVLINAGGFARNQAMRDRYIPGTSAEWTNVIAEDCGEMIEEGQRLGAAVAQMEERVGSPMAFPPENPKIKPGMQSDLAKPHAILVDQTGRRYLRESASYVQLCQWMLERNKTVPATPSWMVFDSQYLKKYMLAGSMPGSKKPRAWTESKFLRSGATIEALADACGIDGARLRATVERYNGFVRQNRDEDFGRGGHAYQEWLGDPLAASPSKTLGSIEQGPFYAVQIYPGDVSTFGGLLTDEHARVLRADGSAIPGLYATGTSTASVMGRNSPGAGASIGPSFTWGYVAAQHALSTNS
jgi:3-oxosteroid 1-dehydrogenase